MDHDLNQSVTICPSCGQSCPRDEMLCPVCGTRLDPDRVDAACMEPGDLPPVADPTFGIVGGILETASRLFRHPLLFFRQHRMDTGILRPLLFAFVLRYFFFLVTMLVSVLLSGLSPGPLALAGGALDIFLELFFLGGVIHLSLWFVGGAPGGFRVTFNALSYTRIVAVVTPIPAVGWYLYAILVFAYSIVALARAHRVREWKTLLAVMMPALLMCLVLVVLMTGARW